VAQYVLEHGGAFAMVGGELSLGSGGYAGTEVAEILPVHVPAPAEKGILQTDGFRPVLTTEGKRHPILRLLPGDVANAAAWLALPKLEGVNILQGLRPGASALAVHPRLRGADGPMPVIAVSEPGKGRSMAIATDTTWHWAFQDSEGAEARHPYQTFWNNAIRWLIRDPELELVRIVPEKEAFTPSERVRVEVRVQARDYVPALGAEVSLTAEPLRGGKATMLRGTTGEGGRLPLDLGVLAPGPYRLVARAKFRGDDLGEAREALLVSVPPRELEDPRAAPDVLARIARATGGQMWRAEESPPSDLALRPPRVVRVDQKRAMGYWDNAFVLLLAVVFLGGEWALRRRWGYI
jgi:hypothetical protein